MTRWKQTTVWTGPKHTAATVVVLVAMVAVAFTGCGNGGRNPEPAATADPFTPAPDWAMDLVIYELNPRGFTSPDGAGDGDGSGTFSSLRDRMGYLGDLGITGIWLAGYCRATDHFFGVWSVYACVRPDELDPRLGTADDFTAMTAEARRRGIHVFLDVITHGVLDDSPLVAEHPDWFRGGSWRMADYDYDNPEFRAWWINLWVRYVTEYGVDGFRLDGPNGVAGADRVIEVWHEITRRCAEAGRPIFVFPENARYHARQREEIGFWPDDTAMDPRIRFMCRELSCHDEAAWGDYPPGNYYKIRGSRSRIGYDGIFSPYIPIFFAGEEFDAGQTNLPKLKDGLFGEGGPGSWLYGSRIVWEQLDDPARSAMLADVSRMFAIRRDNRDLIHADMSDAHIISIPREPVTYFMPFARFLPGEKAVVVAANETREAIVFTLDIPLARMDMDGWKRYRVTDLWTGTIAEAAEPDLHAWKVTVPADYTPGGGIRVLRIERAE